MPDLVRTPANYFDKIARANAKTNRDNAERQAEYERELTAAQISGAQWPEEPPYLPELDPENPQLIQKWVNARKDNHRIRRGCRFGTRKKFASEREKKIALERGCRRTCAWRQEQREE